MDLPVRSPSKVYVLLPLCCENTYIPCSKSVMRLLVTGKETNNAFAVVGTGGIAVAPIGFDFIEKLMIVFLGLEGQVNVWAGEKCRDNGVWGLRKRISSMLPIGESIATWSKISSAEFVS